jgi:hypothetical protein
MQINGAILGEKLGSPSQCLWLTLQALRLSTQLSKMTPQVSKATQPTRKQILGLSKQCCLIQVILLDSAGFVNFGDVLPSFIRPPHQQRDILANPGNFS